MGHFVATEAQEINSSYSKSSETPIRSCKPQKQWFNPTQKKFPGCHRWETPKESPIDHRWTLPSLSALVKGLPYR